MKKKVIVKRKKLDESLQETRAVVDREAFVKWKRLMLSPIMNEQSIVLCSDGTEISLTKFPHHLAPLIEHLPKEEREKIMAKKRVWQKVMNTANGYKLKAYGQEYNRVNFYDKEDQRIKSPLHPKKAEIIELFGRMFTIEEVHKIIVEDWKIPVPVRVVYVFKERYFEQIQEKLADFQKTLSDLRLGVKRGRMEELIWMYSVMKDEFKKDHSILRHRGMIANLEQVRKEVEGDTLKIEGNLEVKLEATINQHLAYEVFKNININQIIIARVAAKTATNPMMVVASLMNSYYRKLTGIVEPVDEFAYNTVDVPSLIAYDFNKIEMRQRQYEEERAGKMKQLVEAETIQAEEGKKLDLKSRLLAMVAASREMVEDKAELVETSILNLQKNKKSNHDV